MPVNKVLAPIGEHNTKDFAPANNQIGWVKMTNNTASGLVEISDNILQDRERANLGDHAIPSPIAHIKHFKNRLDSGDQSALNEWRGMLAVIALQDINGYDISIQDIPLYPDGDGNPTVLGRVICDELIANSNVTGYTANEQGVPDIKKLSIFCKNGQPFAMYMPSMIICPFKRYSIDLFDDVSWYSNQGTPGDANADPKGTWNEVRPEITDNPSILSATARKFYFWLEGIESGQNRITRFKEYILGDATVPQSTQENAPTSCNAYLDSVGSSLPANLKMICPSPIRERVFTDKLLFIIPPSDLYEGGDYQICRNGITPQKKIFDGVCNGPVLVIPPIHKDLIASVCNGSKTVNSWSIDYRNGEYTCRVYITVADINQVFERKMVFKPTQITWTKTMPYISMWPYVKFADDSWKENYVAISAVEDQFGGDNGNSGDYEGLTRNKVCTHLLGKQSNIVELARCPEIKIDVVTRTPNAEVKRYKVSSSYKNKDFTILRSESAPYALDFSYSYVGETFTLGCWVVEDVPSVNAQAGAKNQVIAMDFGTTSTNVFIRPKSATAAPKSMSSAGKYLHNIYNPYATDEAVRLGAAIDSDFLQNYYLFSSKGDAPLGKIFTYGQNFDAVEIQNNGNTFAVTGTIPNVTGRMVVVDDQFILSDNTENTRIYNGLKIKPLDDNGDTDQERKKTTLNFLYTILMYATLEAKANGATSIDLRLSYPSEKQGNAVLQYATNIQTYLGNQSGCAITLRCETEAASAGEFFKNNGHTRYAPSPQNGYVIVDIGGGTTDVSFWKGDRQQVDLKAEHSFAYAGNYLVIRTILQALDNGKSFEDMWIKPSNDPNSITALAIKKYNNITLRKPLSTSLLEREAYMEKAAVLDFLLDHKEDNKDRSIINSDNLSDSAYQNFLSAIRLKYYALFRLVANYMLKNTNIEINQELGFNIYLAGCGSKGIETFANCNSLTFESNVKQIFYNTLGVNDRRINLVPPELANKEEVVMGLTYFEDNQNNGGMPRCTAGRNNRLDRIRAMRQNRAAVLAESETIEDEAKNTATENLEFDTETVRPPEFTEDDAFEAYESLLAELSEFESKNQLLQKLSTVEEFNPEGFIDAEQVFYETWQNIANELDQFDFDPNTYAEHFALLMLENMINELI